MILIEDLTRTTKQEQKLATSVDHILSCPPLHTQATERALFYVAYKKETILHSVKRYDEEAAVRLPAMLSI